MLPNNALNLRTDQKRTAVLYQPCMWAHRSMIINDFR